ncbi:MAG: DUF4136 domain-containing protein [Cyclobacteriaceae bacterium]
MKKYISILIIALIASGCSSVQIFTDYDRNVDFSNYTTFEMAPVQDKLPDEPMINQLNLTRIKRAIVGELEARGYEQTRHADLAVNIYVKVDPRTAVTTMYDGPYFPYRGRFRFYTHWGYYDHWGINWAYSDVQTRNYKVGTLVVDLVDTKNKKLVWQGIATSSLHELRKDPELKINDVIVRMFRRYPYRAGSNIPVATIE